MRGRMYRDVLRYCAQAVMLLKSIFFRGSSTDLSLESGRGLDLRCMAGGELLCHRLTRHEPARSPTLTLTPTSNSILFFQYSIAQLLPRLLRAQNTALKLLSYVYRSRYTLQEYHPTLKHRAAETAGQPNSSGESLRDTIHEYRVRLYFYARTTTIIVRRAFFEAYTPWSPSRTTTNGTLTVGLCTMAWPKHWRI